MTKKVKYTLSINSKKSLNTTEDFLDIVRLHCKMLPVYMPSKHDWTEPIRKNFNPNDLSNLVDSNGKTDNTWWKRTEKPKANGGWMRSGVRSGNHSSYTHASISLNVWETSYQGKLIEYLKQASIQCEADIGFIDSVTDDHKQIAIQSWYAPYGGDLMLTTKTLRNWLPEMPWAVVFGSAYIQMFGKEKLLNTPAFKVEEIGDEIVYIQLTPNMEDIHEQYEKVMQARTNAKKHLGEECFFKSELAYDFNAHPDKAGKVFKVPMFDLLEDKR
jgi:hypothetical protein